MPKCLGKPVCLAHSISSPDLPIPILEVPNDPPSPIITLHSTPLASPNTNTSSADDLCELIILNDTYDLNAQYLLPKKYGRSHSEMILPNIEVSGELNDITHSQPFLKSDSLTESVNFDSSLISSSEPQPLFKSKSLTESSESKSLSKTKDLVEDELLSQAKFLTSLENKSLTETELLSFALESNESLKSSPVNLTETILEPENLLNANISDTRGSRSVYLEVDNKKHTKRSRSLSPCPPNCLCYNCNVSKLIKQSLDLSPSERSNFNTYFVRSLSHKFNNCSCYSLSTEKIHKSLYDSWQGRLSSSMCPLSSDHSKRSSPQEAKSHQYSRRIDEQKNIAFKRFRRQLKNKTMERQCCVWSKERVTNKLRPNGRPETNYKIRSMSCPNLGEFKASNPCFLYSSCSLDSLHPLCLMCSHVYHKAHSSLDLELDDDYKPGFNCSVHCNKIFYHNCHYLKYHQTKCPKIIPIPKLQHQRSFSSPDTRPSIIEPDPTCTARRHRHSISGQMSYFKLLGYNVSKKLTGSANSLFSTAVISGSSSAPNLKDMIPAHASAVAGELLYNYFDPMFFVFFFLFELFNFPPFSAKKET